MSYDGSFVLESALERFLARNPNLRFVPQLAALSQKGGALADDELVATIADPFLHPIYTIPIMGCFRPLARKIVLRVVSKLQKVSNLDSESNESKDEVGVDCIYVIDFYVGRGRGLRLHELASLAFCRALDLAPYLLSCILNYFRFSPPPFRRLLSIGYASTLTEKDALHLLDAIRISYRFLLMNSKVFAELWDLSCFLDLAYQMVGCHLSGASPSSDNILDMRWCAIQVLSLRISDRSTREDQNFGMSEVQAFTCLLRWEEFCQDTSLEKAGWYFQDAEVGNGGCLDEVINFSQWIESFENESKTNSNGLFRERRNCRNNFSQNLKFSGASFVMTATVKKSFEMVLMAVNQRWPVLLHGAAGAGKTILINRLAEISGNQVLFIHMDEQMDGKTLVGSYVCSERPGEFRWQPGSLSQAILNGFWVVFEDIDKAPNEVQSLILPLLEGSSSFATGHGEVLIVAESFRLFATISTSKHESCHSMEGRFSFSALWRKVKVGAASTNDMVEMVNKRYPSLEPFSRRLVDTFQRFNFGGIEAGGVMVSGTFNRISIRDLLKWCKRLTGSSLNTSAIDCQKIYQEAIDIFAASLPFAESRLFAMGEIAKIWDLPRPENLYPPSKPVIQDVKSDLRVGRVTLPLLGLPNIRQMKPFAGLRSSLHVLERIACSVKYNESVLLVGETGTGKTTLVQNLATRLGQTLTVMNLSQQSDVTDLLGGFKPTDARSICLPLYHEFKKLFCRTVSGKENEAVLRHCEVYAMEKKWKKLLKACQKSVNFILKHIGKSRESGFGSKRKRPLCEEILNLWESFSLRLDNARKQFGSSAGMSFKFVEGAFITALRNGHWILLDEVNLAPPESLQRIIGVLDGEKGTLCLAERGDIDYVERHPQFRLFACMNPATDAGKRELPYSFRSWLTEFFVDDDLDDEDLTVFVNQYLDEKHHGEMSGRIVQFYKAAKMGSKTSLQDGANQKPQFSLRSLARALEYTKKAEREFKNFQKAIYDGFCMFFLTLLDCPSAKHMKERIFPHLLVVPSDVPFDAYLHGKVDWGSDGFMNNYVRTPSVEKHLNNLARAVYIKRYPVLLQGPTSSGKTSLVQYLATYTGHKFVRINNHEHTDLQEYLGSYITDSQGKLQFQEGVLVKAVRNGYWIVLDELNLAPSDVLEALNRLLDDNREIFVPEIQETVPAHPEFMLFATQNPPNLYGGRKVLSRAFRNRFLEIHVDEIPDDELSEILNIRCKIPRSYANEMVKVMMDLQLHRQNSKAFAGKHGFITPRDLFRWANRFREFGKSCEDWTREGLAKEGYLLLAERLRDESEKNVVLETLKRRLGVDLVTDNLYTGETTQMDGATVNNQNIVWTKSMQRLFFLVERCYRMREPVLLVGETGGGKTTVCQLLSAIKNTRLHILNCHQYTEASDFIGGFHPIRDRSRLSEKFESHIEGMKRSKVFLHLSHDFVLSTDISQASSTIKKMTEIEKNAASFPGITHQDLDGFVKTKLKLVRLQQKWQSIFFWQNGPLVKAMVKGDFLLVDEISLADDSVLERLNSVLEPEGKLLLAEKGGLAPEEIIAHENFFILATMNPGGDYGKKELSPALRNRFTEIWVSSVTDVNELQHISCERLAKSELFQFADHILKFWQWFNQLQTGRMLTVRDLLSWISFIKETEASLGSECAFIHGAFLVVLDGLSLGSGISKSYAKLLIENAFAFILELLKGSGSALTYAHLSKLENYGWGAATKVTDDIFLNDLRYFGINPFYITKGHNPCKSEGFAFLAPTTCKNALRVLRAMQLPKPVLLEGSPGVGKTSLVIALAEYSGHDVVRINLSEQTDMMDLLGSELPIEGENGMEFAWSDGILLQALQKGSWVLLDELNLAPQSVLEGLNAILDHRAEVYIPELGKTFKCPPSFRFFACQNPSSQGGGRKGLPKSFLNRFTKVYVDELSAEDYLFICQSRYPSIPATLLSKLILFNNCLYEDIMISRKYGQEGSPWEFNLRDVIRSCELIKGAPKTTNIDSFLNIVYLQRMRTAGDRKEVVKLYESVFGVKPSIVPYPELRISPKKLLVGNASVERSNFQPRKIMQCQLHMLPGIHHILEAVVQCVQQQWLCILVGPYSSGKTSLIRLLAQLTGNALVELNLSSATDVSELLGCFEQYNSFRIFRDVVSRVERYVGEYFAILGWKDLKNEGRSLFIKWFSFLAASNHNSSMTISTFAGSWNYESPATVSTVLEIIELLRGDLNNLKLPVSWSCDDLDRTLKILLDLQQNMKIQQPAKFVWMAGDLIKAIECGDWVVLDNANLCNPTVLDRINSLVEPDGSITVNECGLVNGKPVKLVAHPNFRMFLTMDPRHGEVSRAMRNRGLEIFMMQPNWFADREVHDSDIGEINDVRKFLILSGIPFNWLILAMSEAHTYAKNVGLHLGVHITLLELSRWVQLFQQLLMNGNQLRWSLQLSWEHTYLSSLGEVEGRHIIEQARSSWLSGTEWYKSDAMLGFSLSLPGVWPSPYSIMNFVCHPKEACVRQNCFYLEFLGCQYASFKSNYLQSGGETRPSLLPINVLHHHMFPNASLHQKPVKFDEPLVKQMLYFAANWVLEQATESDFSLYVEWFKWWKNRLQQNCFIFETFLEVLDKELDHPIWTCIFKCQKEIISHQKIDVDAWSIRLLSTELVELAGSDGSMITCKRLLCNAVCCVPFLRRTIYQWKDEENYLWKDGDDSVHCREALKHLRCLENKALEVVLESQTLLKTYSNLLNHHELFWKSYKSSQFECLSLNWYWLKKEAMRLQHRFPEEVTSLKLVEIPICSYKFMPTLWVQGGHRFLPSSADVYYKMKQLFSFCDKIWQRSKNQVLSDVVFSSANTQLQQMAKQAGSGLSHDSVVLSANTELRQIAMQAVCMLSCSTTKGDQDTEEIVHQLEDIYQSLLRRAEHEEKNIKARYQSIENLRNPMCCTFSQDILCTKSGLDSWMVTHLLFDQGSLFLDVNLLPELLKCVLAEPEVAYKILLKTCNSLQHNLGYSICFSSRSPVVFSPHQSILWILDAWGSIDSVNVKLASLLLEMWFNWHLSLWHCSSDIPKKFPLNCWDVSCHIIHLTRTTILDNILSEGTFSIKDYDSQCMKLRVVSRNLWQDVPLLGNLAGALKSIADSLFMQIIFAHRKFFGKDAFDKIKLTLSQLKENGASKKEIQTVKTEISSSTHSILASLVDPVIGALLEELYIRDVPGDYFFSLASALVHIGVLRFDLLLMPDSPDPAMKFSYKHSIVTEKLLSLKLETKVRRDCGRLAGRSSTRGDEQERDCSLQKLEKEQKHILSKLIFRPEPSKYKNLRLECSGFRELVSNCLELVKELKSSVDAPALIDKAKNWQDTSSVFINRLSEVYAGYEDIIQPVQLAIYEMKLGLSFAISWLLEREYLKKVDEGSSERILATAYSLMQFSREMPPGFTPDYLKTSDLPCSVQASDSTKIIDISFLKKLVTIRSNVSSDKSLQATVDHITLIGAAHNACSTLLMDKALFLLLNEIFDRFVTLWMEMKSRDRVREDDEAQYYKFRSRSVEIEDLLEGQYSSLSMSDSDGCLISESEELLMEREFIDVMPFAKVDESVEEDWSLIPESILESLVLVHNQLFGSSDLLEHPGISKISSKDRLCSFLESYRLGVKIIKDLQAPSSSTLDDNLMPEHLLHVCLEHEKTVGTISQVSRTYNIYKDSDASVIFKIVKPLSIIQEKVRSLLEDEHPEHPGLQKVYDVTNSLLKIPLGTPVSKVLLGLQLLVSRAQSLQEDFSISLADQLHPIRTLVSSWQKLELDCWSVLLDEVQEQYATNAGKLWFPLYAILHRDLSDGEKIDTIQSVEDFIQTSSVGEFMKRLQLLLAFHGQLNCGICLEAYSSSYTRDRDNLHMRENLNILYNTFGYYLQFMPVVLEHIHSGRNAIEKEMKECLKLFHWEHTSTENFRRTRQKIWKLVKKFNDILQQPVMVILNEDAIQRREKAPSWLEKKICDENNVDVVQFPMELLQLCNCERFLWCEEWKLKSESAIKCMLQSSTSDVDLLQNKEIWIAAWMEGWNSLEKICRRASEFAHVWKHGMKNFKKRRAFGDLLKTLETCGLSRHKTMVAELELKGSHTGSSFLQPSYDVVHLLQFEFCPSSKACSILLPGYSQKPADDKFTSTWKAANKFYFKNLGMVQQLRQVCLNFNKDLSLEQVNRAVSFIDHLISIQQEQRLVAYGVAEKLQILRQQFTNLSRIELGDGCSLSPNQHAVVKCMWRQKNLFDNLLAMSKDVQLLLLSVKVNHKNTCDIVKAEAETISALIDKFIPIFTQSKASLDVYLLGSDRAVVMSVKCLPFIVSQRMEELIAHNFQVLHTFEQHIKILCLQKDSRRSIKESLLNRLEKLIIKGKVILTDFNSEIETNHQSHFEEHSFMGIIEEIKKLLTEVFGKLDLALKDHAILGELSAQNITKWKDLFGTYMKNLHLDCMYDAISKTILSVSKLINCTAIKKLESCSHIDMNLKHLHVSLDLLLSFGENLLSEFLDAHKTISEVTHVLSHVFILLFSKGFGDPEEPSEDSMCDGSKDACGTGMGEGEGVKDVSGEIEDEDQLLGTSDKNGMDKSEKIPSNKDKGVEMDEDFDADTFSVSEDSGDGGSDDGEEINLESKMGETGDDKQAINEKNWNKDEDDKSDNSIEKYEAGPCIKQTELSDKELRAKEDDAASLDESGEAENNECDKQCAEDSKNVISDDENGIDDINLDKKNAFEDPTGIQLSDHEQDVDDVMEEDHEAMQGNDSSPIESDEEMQDDGEQSNPTDHIDNNDEITVQADDNTQSKESAEDAGNAHEAMESSKENILQDEIEPSKYPAPSTDSVDPASYSDNADFSMEPDMWRSNSSDTSNNLAPSRSLLFDNIPKMELSIPDSGENSELASDHQPKPQVAQDDSPSFPKSSSNPYRSIGDAMKEWKERVKVSVDPQEAQQEGSDDIDEESADEYRYVSEVEKATSQALGSATTDQINGNVEGKEENEGECDIRNKEEGDQMDSVQENPEICHLMTTQPLTLKEKSSEKVLDPVVDADEIMEEMQPNIPENSSGGMVSFESSYMSETVLSCNDNLSGGTDLLKPVDIEPLSDDAKQRAVADWKRYELSTAKLSQELAEHLRLVMEPTLASRLQGDYRTGKRINLKKVIPYIASHYRKDKIWLRRTKPSKRDYQVVIAIDDSRSMSEGHCGSAAVESLVTVCRAMSQLEVGQFAVASFGDRGQIKMLLNFDQPLTQEAGVKMISSLSFKQDNTIADEPVVNLLKKMNVMLDAAVMNARLPSGQNPLHQLILIIADGRFHEKENLKRCVRNVLNRKRMVAFILLDSPKESIMDLMEASFEGGKLSFTKYLNSFPFPFYVILKNMEELPRALGDLLSQWFELMQSASD